MAWFNDRRNTKAPVKLGGNELNELAPNTALRAPAASQPATGKSKPGNPSITPPDPKLEQAARQRFFS